MRVYLDHNATSPLRDEVVDSMTRVLRGVHGNPSSVHEEGRSARAAVVSAQGASEQTARVIRELLAG